MEASLAYGMGIYANWHLPIYCMFTVQESDIVNCTAVITRQIIDEFRCADGWIGVVRNGCFERLLNRKNNSGNDIPRTAPCSHIPRADKLVKKEGRRINPLQVSPEGFHRN